MEATIFDIHKLSTHDGPGIRTVFFFKGCSLRCEWCQNPESFSMQKEVWHYPQNCIGCGQCINICTEGALQKDKKKGIRIDYSLCTGCGICTEKCPGKALQQNGKLYTIAEVQEIIKKEEPFMIKSGGGITASGGEPLMQANFVSAIFRECISNNLSTALDTCGQVPWSAFEKVLPFTDIVLYDLKHIDSDTHKQLTGSDNHLILENLVKLVAYLEHYENNISLWIRTPLIPGATLSENNIKGIAKFLMDKLSNKFDRWELCSYNPLPAEKYDRLGMDWKYKEVALMTKEDGANALHWAQSINSKHGKVVLTGLTSKN